MPTSPPASERTHLDYLLTAICSWLLPGSGHWMLGFRLRGVIIGAGLLGLFWFGESALGSNMAVSREVSPILYSCQLGNGLSTLLADNLWGEPHTDMDSRIPYRKLPAHFHLGVLFVTVSGLLNMLAVLHVLDPKTWAAAARSAEESRSRDDKPPEEGG